MKIVLKGIVQRFKGDGRRLGYPTANLDVETALKDGIYFGYADLATWRKHPTVIFVGAPVTMGDGRRRVEAHLLDIPDKDYYGTRLMLSVEHFHRGNRNFEDINQLKQAIDSDLAAAESWFASNSLASKPKLTDT